VRRGDLLFFYVGGAFRSLHTIEGEPYYDDTAL
jgi:hypothetical protein